MFTNESRTHAKDLPLAEQAASWLLALEAEEPGTRAAFADWLLESPAHVEAFLRAKAIDVECGNLGPERTLSVELDAGPRADRWSVVLLRLLSTSTVKYLAACVFLVALAFLVVQGTEDGRWNPYSTAVAEQREVPLQDGSILYLEPDSSVEARFSTERRELRLLSGGAMFKVAHDSRPFVVHAGDVLARAVGTRFRVGRFAGHSVVAVVEGIVEVSPDSSFAERLIAAVAGSPIESLRVTAGKQVSMGSDRRLSPLRPNTEDPLLRWSKRLLVFDKAPLAAMAEEFNRYSEKPKVRVDPIAGEVPFGGTFHADDVAAFVWALEDQKAPVIISMSEDEVVITGIR